MAVFGFSKAFGMLADWIVTEKLIALLSVNFPGDPAQSADPTQSLLTFERRPLQSVSLTERNSHLRYSCWK